MKDSFVKSIDTIHVITKTIEKTSTKVIYEPTNTSTEWVSFWSAIAGGILVIVGQLIAEHFKNRLEKKKELINSHSEIVRQRGILKNLYRQLAMYKIHAVYWWFCTKIESNPTVAEINRQDHLKSQSEARKIEKEIGEATATFISFVAKFETILRKTSDLSKEIEAINLLKTRAVTEYDSGLSYDDVKSNRIIQDENELREEYFNNLQPFDAIIAKLKILIP